MANIQCANHNIRFEHKTGNGANGSQILHTDEAPFMNGNGPQTEGDRLALRIFGKGITITAVRAHLQLWMVIHSELIKVIHDNMWHHMHPNKVQYAPQFNEVALLKKLETALRTRCIAQHGHILAKQAEWTRRHEGDPDTPLAQAQQRELEHLEEDFDAWAHHGFIQGATARRRSRIKMHEVTVQMDSP